MLPCGCGHMRMCLLCLKRAGSLKCSEEEANSYDQGSAKRNAMSCYLCLDSGCDLRRVSATTGFLVFSKFRLAEIKLNIYFSFKLV